MVGGDVLQARPDGMSMCQLAQYRKKPVPEGVKRLTAATTNAGESALYIDGKFQTWKETWHFGELARRMQGEPCVLDWKYVTEVNGQFPHDESDLHVVMVF